MNKIELQNRIKVEAARRKFYYYCQALHPDFYMPHRTYLKTLCDTLEEFMEDEEKKVLFLSMPPQHGKSFTVGNFEGYLLGKNPKLRIITGSYNEFVSTKLSKAVRDEIMTEKIDPSSIVYSDIFPTRIKKGSAKARSWQTNLSQMPNYLSTSPRGTATSFGADLMIIDDLVKDAYEAMNERILEEHWSWFSDTMLSRLTGPKKLIIIGTRWSTRDIIGRYKAKLDEIGKEYVEVKLKLYDEETGETLCKEFFSREEYFERKQMQSNEIFMANYQQEPIDMKNQLYNKGFKTYDPRLLTTGYIDKEGREIKPITLNQVLSYTDTADTGNDYLTTIIFGEYNRQLYVLDVIYTQSRMEETEPIVAHKINKLESTWNEVESNNGGEGFARNVRRILENDFNNYYCKIHPFHQYKNKMARILSEAPTVQRVVNFPEDWGKRWKNFSEDIVGFKTEKNLHDDCADALTGVVELARHKKLID